MHTSPLPSVALGMGSRGLQENAIVSYLEHNFVIAYMQSPEQLHEG